MDKQDGVAQAQYGIQGLNGPLQTVVAIRTRRLLLDSKLKCLPLHVALSFLHRLTDWF
jgi:hypothetical protein